IFHWGSRTKAELPILKPSLHALPHSVSKFQQPTAGEELAGVHRIEGHADHEAPPSAIRDARMSAARTNDSRYANPHRPYLRCSFAKRPGTAAAAAETARPFGS